MPRFSLEFSDGFREDYRSKSPEVRSELDNVLRFLQDPGPTHNSLNSHKVADRRTRRGEGVQVWESYITWSHRITWHYKPGFAIFLRATDGHEILPRR